MRHRGPCEAGHSATSTRWASGSSGRRSNRKIYPEMRDVVRAHMERGHTVMPVFVGARAIRSNRWRVFSASTNTLTNRFEVDDDGLLTGKVVKPILWGPGKANAVQRFAADHDIDLSRATSTPTATRTSR